ncbi:unnamed protein product [Camellia sinensis]
MSEKRSKRKKNPSTMATIKTTTTARKRTITRRQQHIEDIRKHKFSIGEEEQPPNPLTKDLHHAVTNLSAELYTKDLHFLMELIQNAEDNEYLPGVEPTLEFVVTSVDITGFGAPATLLVFNNEIGFSAKNMESICSVGRSTKKGLRDKGFIGEKGIGFKSVFLVTAWPHIFSNGYQVRFNEMPNKDCGVGYVVPEWIDDKPTVSDIQQIYGNRKVLPKTTIILPLKPEKVAAVRKQLSEVHPEVLLFLCKIKRLSIQEHNGESPAMDPVSAISMSSETNLTSSTSQGADSRIVNLSVKGTDFDKATCCYYIWRQTFPVNAKSQVSGRKDIKEWVISLAFPSGDRLKRGASSVGIFAFLPTAMVTNYPFIVQADFKLASSRETILLDNKWNLGILDLVPSCFVNALMTCMKSAKACRLFSTPQFLEFLPTEQSPIKELEMVRQSIRTMVQAERILPCESFLDEQETFCQPTKAMRILPEFRKILVHLKECGVPLNEISSIGMFVLHASLDHKEYDGILDFLGVPSVGKNYCWYGRFIRDCNIMSEVPVDVYMELLCFFADNCRIIPSRHLNNAPLLKYVALNGEVRSCSISQVKKEAIKMHLILEARKHAWINKWNVEMGCPNNLFFLPNATVTALAGHERHYFLRRWLVKMGVIVTSVSQYCLALAKFAAEKKDPKIAVSLSHLVYHSKLKYYIGMYEVFDIFRSLPIVDRSGKVHIRTKTLVPASGSNWEKLFGSENPFAEQSIKVKTEIGESEFVDEYVELGEVYTKAANFAGESATKEKFLDFLANHTGALDLPYIPPPNTALQVAYTQLTSDQAILLLDWIHIMITKGYNMPPRFIESIRNGKWVKTHRGFSPPTHCLLCNETEESTLLEMGDIHQLFPIIDQEFYMGKITKFKDELELIGVQIGSENMYQLIIKLLEANALSSMGREWAIFLLKFVRHSKVNHMLNQNFLKAVREGKWLKTNRGYNTPVGSIFLISDAVAILQIASLPVIDQAFYEGQMDCFADELNLMGVVVDREGVFRLILDNFQFPKELSTLTRDSIFLILDCIKHLGPAAFGVLQKIRELPWMKTSSGFKCPTETLLPNHKWGHLLSVVPLPIIDETHYGIELKLYKAELKAIGVAVDLDGVFKMLSDQFKFSLSSGRLTNVHVISTLNCMKCMGKKKPSQLFELRSCLMGDKWLKTSHGYKYTSESVLFDSKWGTIAQFVNLPLIDESFYGNDIYLYKDQLKMLGVVVDFSEGAHFVARGLCLPKEPALLTADSALSLLQCVKSLRMNSSGLFLLKDLVDKLRGSKWMKTHIGYRYPEESLLFDPEWTCYLEKFDAPFIDECFYKNFPSLSMEDLKAVGVKVDIEEACKLISRILNSHTQTCVIMRIYKFLNRFKWIQRVPDPSLQIWIPDPLDHSCGTWVNSRNCVIHDRDSLFGSRLHALDKYYETELSSFLRVAFRVAEFPCLGDYVKLWNHWVSSHHEMSQAECSSFWKYISENWNSVTEEILKTSITMLPACCPRGETIQIRLMQKNEILIPDDLQLRRLFANSSVKPIFTWYPQSDSSSLSPSKLSEIYSSLGVRKLSKSVQFNWNCPSSVSNKFEEVDSKNCLIGKGLIKIVLGFLASPQVNTTAEERNKIANTLLDISVVLAGEPLEVSYRLQIPSLDNPLSAKTRRLVMWDKSSNRLIVYNSCLKHLKNNIEFVIDFALAVSEGLLPNRADDADRLCKIIQTGLAFEFKEDAVDFLLMRENLELSATDRDFLSTAFPCPSESSSPLQSAGNKATCKAYLC